MNSDQFDKRMRVFETAHDHCVLPGIHIVARLDGRNFTRLTKTTLALTVPFDVEFHNHMLAVVGALCEEVGFKIIYAYTESDEISLLFSPKENSFGRKVRKFNSILAGAASSYMSLELDYPVIFDCRISQLPSDETVIDYFRWRMADAHRNSLNSWSHWALTNDGASPQDATQALKGMKVDDMNELLFGLGINFNDLPLWQKRGTGFYYRRFEKRGVNPITNEEQVSTRRQLFIDDALPMGDGYEKLIRGIIKRD